MSGDPTIPLDEATSLSVEEKDLLDQITLSMNRFTDICARRQLKLIQNKFDVRKMTIMANKVLDRIPTTNICETNALIYSVAYVITRRLSGEKTPDTVPSERHSDHTPPWKLRIQKYVHQLRREVNQLTSVLSSNSTSSLQCKLLDKYSVKQRGLKVALEDAKRCLVAVSHRLKRYATRCDQFRQNKLFRDRPGCIYKQLENKASQQSDSFPDKTEVQEFWGIYMGSF